VGGVGGGLWWGLRKPTRTEVITMPDGSKIVLHDVRDDGPSPAEQEKLRKAQETETLDKIVKHRFWKKPPSAEQVKKLAETTVRLQSDALVYVDDHYQVVIIDGDAARQWRRTEKEMAREHVGIGSPEGIGDRYFRIDMNQWAVRPTTAQVLDDILSGIERADFSK
jgi:hypothetical protein